MLVGATLACLCLIGAIPAWASAEESARMIELCADGQSVTGFTVKQYQSALEHLSTEDIEYHSECVEEIQAAELAAAGHRGGGGSGGSARGRGLDGGSGGGRSPLAGEPVEPTPAQERMLEATREGGAPAVRLGGGVGGSLSPGVVQPDLASAASDLPGALIVVIVAVIGGILLLSGREIRERMRRSRHA
jgi:hypothetical protein